MEIIYSFNKKINIKDIVIMILSKEHPLSARKIYYLVKKQKSVSYQAVYKILNNMEKEKILKKSNLNYSISKEWINQLDKFLIEIEQAYSPRKGNINKLVNNLKKEGDILMITANSLSESKDYQKIIKKQVYDKYKNVNISNRPKIVSLKSHFGSTIFETKSILKGYDHSSMIFPYYAIVKNKTFLDEWARKITMNNPLTSKYKNIKIGVDHGKDYDLKVYDDIVIEIYYPQSLTNKLNQTYREVKSFENFNFFKAFNDLYMKTYPIKMIIYKDKQIADNIKNEIMSKYFSK
jgi:DNA-binding PadR family transcriptional regulator